MSDLTKVKFSKLFFSARFWVVTIISYLASRNISTSQAFQLVGFYYVATIFLEYPTGVIGDYFSHRTSVLWGYFFLALSYVLMALSGSMIYYAFTLLILALGQALVSGSDIALLHSVSRDFQKDFSQIKIYSLVVSFAAVSIGGFAGAYDLRYPLYLTALFLVAALVMLIGMKNYKYEKMSGNIIATGIEGFRHVFENEQLPHLMIVSAMLGAFFL